MTTTERAGVVAVKPDETAVAVTVGSETYTFEVTPNSGSTSHASSPNIPLLASPEVNTVWGHRVVELASGREEF